MSKYLVLIAACAGAVALATIALQVEPAVSAGGQSMGREGNAQSLDDPRDLRVTGKARIIDGDGIDIGGEVIRLAGIDAPERGQVCGNAATGYRYAGREASNVLKRLIGGRRVVCTGRKRDRHGRLIGTCRVGSTEINAALVRQGQAWAYRKYSRRYILQEASARRAQLGIWSVACKPAWEFRRDKKIVAQMAPDGRCPIKGNIARTGERIYHVPNSRFYAVTSIAVKKGERWFCTEDEAVAAGWRAARAR
ncbi:MAG: thermonuclease family protein [Pseudomonadota bacterium]